MASKRILKKQIHYLCGDIAGESLVAKALIPGADADKLTDVIVKTAELQTAALSRVNVTFDKTPREFENRKAYHKARREFYHAAFKSIRDGFNNHAAEIVKELNEALPKK